MLERIGTCPRCGETDEIVCFPIDDAFDHGVPFSAECRGCQTVVEVVVGWEAAHHVLRMISLDLRFRCHSSRPWAWKPLRDFYNLGSDRRLCIRAQVTENWFEILPPNVGGADNLDLSVRDWRSWIRKFAASAGAKPLIRAALQTAGNPDSNVVLQRIDYLRCFWDLNPKSESYNVSIGQPLAS